VIKNFPGFRRDFRAKMWGTSSPDDKLADDLGNAIEGWRISGRRSDFLTAGKLAPGYFGLLQQNRHIPAVSLGARLSGADGSGHYRLCSWVKDSPA
jgi:hypothetical protein